MNLTLQDTFFVERYATPSNGLKILINGVQFVKVVSRVYSTFITISSDNCTTIEHTSRLQIREDPLYCVLNVNIDNVHHANDKRER